MPNKGKRAIIRGRDDDYGPFPQFDVDGYKVLHLDGHQPDAALHYAKLCRERGILVSLDGGTFRPSTKELLPFIDVAVVSQDFCNQIGKGPMGTLKFLREHGCKVGAVTLGEGGIVWYDGDRDNPMAPFHVPSEKVIDTSGAGDVFHGAYVFSYLRNPEGSWEDHFRFASAASAHKIQYLGIEAGLPLLEQVESLLTGKPRPVAVRN